MSYTEFIEVQLANEDLWNAHIKMNENRKVLLVGCLFGQLVEQHQLSVALSREMCGFECVNHLTKSCKNESCTNCC